MYTHFPLVMMPSGYALLGILTFDSYFPFGGIYFFYWVVVFPFFLCWHITSIVHILLLLLSPYLFLGHQL